MKRNYVSNVSWLLLLFELLLLNVASTQSNSMEAPFQYFLQNAMSNYSNWLLANNLDPTEEIPFTNLTDKDNNIKVFGNMTNQRIFGHSNLRLSYLMTNFAKSQFKIQYQFYNYSAQGHYVFEGTYALTHINGSGAFNITSPEGFIGIECENFGKTEAGYIDLSVAIITLESGAFIDWRTIPYFDGLNAKIAERPVKYFLLKSYVNGQKDWIPLTRYLRQYLEVLFNSTSIAEISKTTLAPPTTTTAMPPYTTHVTKITIPAGRSKNFNVTFDTEIATTPTNTATGVADSQHLNIHFYLIATYVCIILKIVK